MLYTYRFAFRGRNRFIDAANIFDAMVQFHALHEGTTIGDIDELVVTKLN